jgi:hypothetical protein
MISRKGWHWIYLFYDKNPWRGAKFGQPCFLFWSWSCFITSQKIFIKLYSIKCSHFLCSKPIWFKRARRLGMLVISCSNRQNAKKYCWKAEQCMALHPKRRIRRSFNQNFHINFSYLTLTLKYLINCALINYDFTYFYKAICEWNNCWFSIILIFLIIITINSINMT